VFVRSSQDENLIILKKRTSRISNTKGSVGDEFCAEEPRNERYLEIFCGLTTVTDLKSMFCVVIGWFHGFWALNWLGSR
jgi:hypothetical protein